jgi:hypothetical protein
MQGELSASMISGVAVAGVHANVGVPAVAGILAVVGISATAEDPALDGVLAVADVLVIFY